MSKKHYIIPIFVPHEGCPHNCVFCNQNTITGVSNEINADFVQSTVEEYLNTIDQNNAIVEVSFFGGTFTAIDINKQKELLSSVRKYKETGRINYIRLSTRPDYIDDKILSNLKENLVDIIELGVQSMDEDVLKQSGRGHSSNDVVKASNLIKEFGFVLGHQIMIGLPGDTFEKDIYTVKNIIELTPDMCRIYPALVIKNTPMETLYYNGIYKPYTLNEAIEISKILYIMLISNNINVIRIGLQPTEEINEGGEIAAGPFHPAFRELVESKILNEMILNECPKNFTEQLFIKLNSRDLSKLFSNGKKFFSDIKKQLPTQNIKIIQDDNINRGSFILKCNEFCKNLSFYDYINKTYKEGYFNIL
ncbi:MAG: radical SAM protein [Bacillota bacterium]|nr:radical SAM protein [Bacillota bacterium]